MKEIWKDVPGYEGYYQASNLGRIKSLERKVEYINQEDRILKEKIMKLNPTSRGYIRISLCKKGRSRSHFVHRLIVSAFIGESNLQVNHIDGVKTNNNIENLEYVTPQENVSHAVRIGLIKNSSKINEKLIIKDYKNGFRLRQLEKKYKTSHQDIRKVLKANDIEIESKGIRRRRYEIDELVLKQLIDEGYNNSEISRKLNVSRHSVRYRRQLLESTEAQI
ncbi:NUMOD4 motif-containing HNH endonuclease [Mammaliicoccus sciuri]|uniref:NUMOD4 motif-containing HNH endonuclease n=1 Tax=Mammaliicoccus sciuri TaxID=1296 RepID=UPI002DBA7AE0|nr:NUMOD4 motif-containing HNH endonuclease [Mammaliicoccus sciuri]MEB5649029.1 NUMOD4 motif-containing HNH endonuclease [Mammaliicoccus sciuri]